MSWSFQAIGKPSKIPAAIDKAIEGYGPDSHTNLSRREFAAAALHLKALVLMNGDNFAVNVEASGHAQFGSEGRMAPGSCSVKIEPIYGLVE